MNFFFVYASTKIFGYNYILTIQLILSHLELCISAKKVDAPSLEILCILQRK